MTTRELGIHEELLLLAFEEDTGKAVSGTWLGVALPGAVVAELLLRDRLQLVPKEGEGEEILEAVGSGSTGDEVLDEALETVEEEDEAWELSRWILKLSGMKKLRHRVARGLCRKGVLRNEEKQVLLLFKRRLYPEVDPAPERELRDRIREALVGEAEVDPRTAALVALADAGALLRPVLGKEVLEACEERVEAIVSGDAAGEAAAAAGKAARTAATVATTMI